MGDLVNYGRKNINIIKVIIVILLILLIAILAFVVSYNVRKKEIINKQYNQEQNALKIIEEKKQEEQKKEEEKKKEDEKKNKLPKFSEEILNNVTNIYHSTEKRVFLTFDDGPSNKITPQVLEILKSEDIKATFFLLGSRVELYPELVKREYEEGHFLANHGYSHTYSKIYSSPESVLEEYNKTTQAIRNAIGIPEYDSHLFRFPGGLPGGKYKEVKKQAKELLNSNNIANVDWNALTGDAEGKKTVDDQMSYAIKTIGNKNSVVILMHDAADKQITVEVLPQLIKYLKENGYRFANFSEIMK